MSQKRTDCALIDDTGLKTRCNVGVRQRLVALLLCWQDPHRNLVLRLLTSFWVERWLLMCMKVWKQKFCGSWGAENQFKVSTQNSTSWNLWLAKISFEQELASRCCEHNSFQHSRCTWCLCTFECGWSPFCFFIFVLFYFEGQTSLLGHWLTGCGIGNDIDVFLSESSAVGGSTTVQGHKNWITDKVNLKLKHLTESYGQWGSFSCQREWDVLFRMHEKLSAIMENCDRRRTDLRIFRND